MFRTGRAEEKEACRHSNGKHKAMEVLFAKVQAQFEKEDNGTEWSYLEYVSTPMLTGL